MKASTLFEPEMVRVPETHTSAGWSTYQLRGPVGRARVLTDAESVPFGLLYVSDDHSMAMSAAPEVAAALRALCVVFARMGLDAMDTPAAKTAIAALLRSQYGGRIGLLATSLMQPRGQVDPDPLLSTSEGQWAVLTVPDADPWAHEIYDQYGALVAQLSTTRCQALLLAAALELRYALRRLVEAMRAAGGPFDQHSVVRASIDALRKAGVLE